MKTIKALLTAFKGRALLILGGLVIALASLLRISGLRTKRLKRQNKQLKADLEMKEKIEEADQEIDSEWSDKLREENLDKVPDYLSKPRKRL